MAPRALKPCCTSVTENMPMQYAAIFKPVKMMILDEKHWYLSYFCSKQRFVFLLFFFLFSLMSLSNYFTHRDEPIGRWGETGVPQENHLTHPQAELGLSHMWPVRARTYTRHSGEMIKWLRALKYSDLTHSAPGAAKQRLWVPSADYI